MDGLLVIDKPVGPTSHDAVARVRRALGVRRIGHTGTLDPGASGVLALVVGRATRLAQFLTYDSKTYEARVQLGVFTDTDDADGEPVGERFQGDWPPIEAVHAALEALQGTRLQRPPAYSAKKIGGRRSYAIARAHTRGGEDTDSPQPKPVEVTLHQVAITGYENGVLELRLTCSAGFYVRALARDLGEGLATGAHLAGLRRTRSGGATLDRALSLATVEAEPARARECLVLMADMLPDLPAIRLTDAGARRAQHGSALAWSDIATSPEPWPRQATAIKLLTPTGDLIGIGRANTAPVSSAAGEDRRGGLQPWVVLA